MSSKFIVWVAVAGALALAALSGAITTARATYPGKTNGRLAFAITVDGNTDVHSVLPGRALHRLTNDPGFDACPNVDVWAIDVEGGDLTRLTDAPGFDRFPAWSPDGTKIVFQSSRTGIAQVWMMNPDGSDQTQLTFDPVPKDQLPDWSPDGRRIAFVEQTHPVGGDIWVMNADGGDPHPITSGADKLGAAWSPDGSAIATLDWPSRTVEIIMLDTTEARAVYPGGVQFVPGWQPRGTGLDEVSQ